MSRIPGGAPDSGTSQAHYSQMYYPSGTSTNPQLTQNISGLPQNSAYYSQPLSNSGLDPNISHQQLGSNSLPVSSAPDDVANAAAYAAYYMNMNAAYNPYAAAAAAMAAAYNPATHTSPHAVGATASAQSGMSNGSTTGEVSVWVGDLDAYMDETFLRAAVASAGWSDHVVRIKIIRDRSTGAHAGYGFLQVSSLAAAQSIIQYGNGMPIAMTNRSWRLQMGKISSSDGQASNFPDSSVGYGSAGANGAGNPEANVYVGDLDPAVTDYELLTLFRSQFMSVRHAKVMCDEVGHSRGYGFVRFSNMADAQAAVSALNGAVLRSRSIRVNIAHRSAAGGGQGTHDRANASSGTKRRRDTSSASPDAGTPGSEVITTLFIGGTGPNLTESILWQVFSEYGTVETVKLPVTKTGFAFVRYASRALADSARLRLNSTVVPELNPNRAIRVEWAAEQLPIPTQSDAQTSFPPAEQDSATETLSVKREKLSPRDDESNVASDVIEAQKSPQVESEKTENSEETPDS